MEEWRKRRATARGNPQAQLQPERGVELHQKFLVLTHNKEGTLHVLKYDDWNGKFNAFDNKTFNG